MYYLEMNFLMYLFVLLSLFIHWIALLEEYSKAEVFSAISMFLVFFMCVNFIYYSTCGIRVRRFMPVIKINCL